MKRLLLVLALLASCAGSASAKTGEFKTEIKTIRFESGTGSFGPGPDGSYGAQTYQKGALYFGVSRFLPPPIIIETLPAPIPTDGYLPLGAGETFFIVSDLPFTVLGFDLDASEMVRYGEAGGYDPVQIQPDGYPGFQEVSGLSIYSPVLGGVTIKAPSTSGIRIDNLVVKYVTALPEPQTWALMLVGFGLLGTAVRRQRASAVGI